MVHYDVIVVGAGVVGPAIATGLARQGRKVLIVERDWSPPDRIVGELLQPGGLKALRVLGMVQSINNIEAVPEKGYTVFYEDEQVSIPYPHKADAHRVEPLRGCVFDGNDKVVEDEYITIQDFEENEFEVGVSFEHGRFINNLRTIVKGEENVTCVEGTVTSVIKDTKGVHGVVVKRDGDVSEYTADLTVMCDGIFSKFRKVLSPDNTPTVESHFVALKLENAVLPVPNTGHVILNSKCDPILVYQTTPSETRVLCAYNHPKMPQEPKVWLSETVLPVLPDCLKPSFKEAIEKPVKSMPNSYLTARANEVPGLFLLGDSLNMRHPLTGGGMTVGLNDAVLLVRLLEDVDLTDSATVNERVMDFHYERKNLDAVINILSIALFSLFAANSSNLKILQRGCFRYFQLGGDCVKVPVSFLSGTNPHPFFLTWTFTKVAIYSIWCNFKDNGLLYLPLSIVQIFTVLISALIVFTPYLVAELFK